MNSVDCIYKPVNIWIIKEKEILNLGGNKEAHGSGRRDKTEVRSDVIIFSCKNCTQIIMATLYTTGSSLSNH